MDRILWVQGSRIQASRFEASRVQASNFPECKRPESKSSFVQGSSVLGLSVQSSRFQASSRPESKRPEPKHPGVQSPRVQTMRSGCSFPSISHKDVHWLPHSCYRDEHNVRSVTSEPSQSSSRRVPSFMDSTEPLNNWEVTSQKWSPSNR